MCRSSSWLRVRAIPVCLSIHHEPIACPRGKRRPQVAGRGCAMADSELARGGARMVAPQWSFRPFWLDPANACLWRETQQVPLPPKAFDVLHYLVTHADRLVTIDAVLDAVWSAMAVSD